MADQDNRTQALGQVKRRAEDGKKAMAEYEARAIAIRAKTERLRALRLAQEGNDGAAAPKRTAATKKKSGKNNAGANSTLSQWLGDQERSGRRT